MKKILGLAALSLLVGCSTNVTSDGEPEGTAPGDESTGEASSAFVSASFTVKGLANKCIDVGGDAYQAPGKPVFLYGCNGTTAQTLSAVEMLDGSFDFRLVSSMGYCLGVRGGSVATGRALELQTCVNAPSTIPSTQRFAFDGDTLFVGTQANGQRVARNLVVEVNKGRGVNRTPLVVGARDLDPAEDFRFLPTNPYRPYPSSAFIPVRNVGELDAALAQAASSLASGHPGTVIEVAAGTSIRIDDANWRFIPGGTTLRGNRRGMNDGPEIYRANTTEGTLFDITGDDVRVTGLRIRGFTTSKDEGSAPATGILSHEPAFHVLVDHAELSGWTNAAVAVKDAWDSNACYFGSPTAQNTRVVANYIHDNSKKGLGYGVVSGDGGNPFIDGNTFARNRHAVAADHRGQTSYTAMFNLVTESNEYCEYWGLSCWKEHDFDVHGSAGGTSHEGGTAAYLVYMTSNTFMPNGINVRVRGTPCNLVRIDNNVFFANHQGDAIENMTTIDYRVQLVNNAYPARDNTSVQGDFDGDGIVDDFIGTGTAWYYRPGRSKEWRLLNRFNERHQRLTFGDFDGDGRTDARIVDASGKTVTSWGASSPWDDGSNPRTLPPVIGALPIEMAPLP